MTSIQSISRLFKGVSSNPFSSFSRLLTTSKKQNRLEYEGSHVHDWSQNLSYSSPESDFSAGSGRPTYVPEKKFQVPFHKWSESLSYASPESDFCGHVTKSEFFDLVEQQPSLRDELSYSLSYTSDSKDFERPSFYNALSDQMKDQLRNVDNNKSKYTGINNRVMDHANPRELVQTTHPSQDLDIVVNAKNVNTILRSSEALPRTWHDATRPQDSRAIVVTEAQVPFRIVSVNHSWENLCGYTSNECRGKTLSIIQGPETNQSAITNLMSQLLRGEEAGTVLTNYNKNGTKFQNRLQVGPLRNELGQITHFVGVLKEIKEVDENFGAIIHA